MARPEINILHAQSHPFHDPHSCAVEQAQRQGEFLRDHGQHPLNLLRRKDDGEFDRPLRPGDFIQQAQRFQQDAPVEKYQGIESLVLGRSGDVFAGGQMSEEQMHLGRTHFLGVPLVMEEDEPANPEPVGLFATQRVVMKSHDFAQLLTQSELGVRKKKGSTGWDSWTSGVCFLLSPWQKHVKMFAYQSWKGQEESHI